MKNILYILIATLSFTACENEIPFDVQDNPPKLIINSLLDAEKTENEIALALTGRETIKTIEDAVIDIYVNGQLKEHITTPPDNYPIRDNSPRYYKTHIRFSPKDVIKIEVRANDAQYFAWAEVVVPDPINIEKIDTTTILKRQTWGDTKYIRVRTTFTDNGHSKNYYRIITEKYDLLEIRSDHTGNDTIVKVIETTPALNHEDIVLTDGRPSTDNRNDVFTPVLNKYGVFDNSRINGTYTMTTGVMNYGYYEHWYWPNPKDIKKVTSEIKVRLLSISRMEYLYLKALNIYDAVSYDDFFNLPVQFPSNVEGGTGIVGVSTETNITIPLLSYKPSILEDEYPSP